MRSICRDSLLPRLNSGGPAGSIGKLFCWAVLLTVAKIVKIRKMDQGFYPAIPWSTVGNRRPNVLFPARQSHGLRRGIGHKDATLDRSHAKAIGCGRGQTADRPYAR